VEIYFEKIKRGWKERGPRKRKGLVGFWRGRKGEKRSPKKHTKTMENPGTQPKPVCEKKVRVRNNT